MARINPSSQDYDPTNDLQHTGEFVAKCVAVKQGVKLRNQPNWKTRVVIEFNVWTPNDDSTHAKKVAIMCGESIYVNPHTGDESRLIQHARSMGITHPEDGFDPMSFSGKWYLISVYFENGRFWVREAIPTEAPSGAPLPPPPPEPARKTTRRNSADIPF